MKTKRSKPSSPAPCSAAFAGCIVGFALEGRRLAVVPTTELGDRLFKLSGRNWKADGISGGVCGVFFTVKFETALPTAAAVEAVRNTITAELNRPQNKD